MKHLLLTTIAAVVLVGCEEAQPPEPTTTKEPDINIHKAAEKGNIEAVKQHLAAGMDVNAKDKHGRTTLHAAAVGGSTEVVELLIAKGADLNADDVNGKTPLDWSGGEEETADLLRKHGGKTGEELKAEGK